MMPDDLAFPKVPKREFPEVEERGYLSARQKVALIEKQRKKCAICGGRPARFEFDHIQELSLGGTNAEDNWQALCRDCHVAKSRTGHAERKVMRRKRDQTSQWARRKKKLAKRPHKFNRDGSVSVR